MGAPNTASREKYPAANVDTAFKIYVCVCEYISSCKQRTHVMRQNGQHDALPERKEYHKFYSEELWSAGRRERRTVKRGGRGPHGLLRLQFLRTQYVKHDQSIPANK